MLYNYRFKNFASYADWTKVSFELDRNAPRDDLAFETPDGERVSKLLAVFGANASGKTNLLKPLAFADWFVSRSFQQEPTGKVPVESFFDSDEPTEVEIEFGYAGKRWRYELALTEDAVRREALYVREPGAKRRAYSYVFKLERRGEEVSYQEQNFGFPPSLATKHVRPNASVISTAAQHNVELALAFQDLNVRTNVVSFGGMHYDWGALHVANRVFKSDPALLKSAVEHLRRFDLGLSDVLIEEYEEKRPGRESEKVLVSLAVHRRSGQEFKRPMELESSGTQAAYWLLSNLLPAKQGDGLAVIDELELHQHPLMLSALLDLFISPSSNPHNAQMIFTCHVPTIQQQLHKQQVMLCERGSDGASRAWRLDEVKGIRSDDNLLAKYLAGAYGGIPEIEPAL
jgi:hypothetical protein